LGTERQVAGVGWDHVERQDALVRLLERWSQGERVLESGGKREAGFLSEIRQERHSAGRRGAREAGFLSQVGIERLGAGVRRSQSVMVQDSGGARKAGC
jgi:hypothetical protein